jgi:hypothetical protein
MPLKDFILIETVRGVVLWSVWLERNHLCFTDGHSTNIKAI